MFRSLSKLFSFSAGNSQRKPAPARRRARLGFEVLEGRALPSASGFSSLVAPIATTSLVQHATVTTPATVSDVPYAWQLNNQLNIDTDPGTTSAVATILLEADPNNPAKLDVIDN